MVTEYRELAADSHGVALVSSGQVQSEEQHGRLVVKDRA
jgi:hypothetical protein